MVFRNQKAHTIANKYIELAVRSHDSEFKEDMIYLRKYLNHIEAQNLGLRQTNSNQAEKLGKRYEQL